jgi:hypothetical protein
MIRAVAQRPRLQAQATPRPKGDEMIVEYIRYKVDPARTDPFYGAIEEMTHYQVTSNA